MKAAARFFEVLIRICGGCALILGLALWAGYGRSFIQLHIGLGIAVVVSLWVLTGMAWRSGARISLVAFAAGWAAVTWALGFAQHRMLPGSLHWLVAVAHLLVGMIAIATGSRLAGTMGSRSTQSSVRARP